MCVHVDVLFLLHVQRVPSTGRPHLLPLSLPPLSPVIARSVYPPPPSSTRTAFARSPGPFPLACHLARGPAHLPEHVVHVAPRTPQSPPPPAALGRSSSGSLPIFPSSRGELFRDPVRPAPFSKLPSGTLVSRPARLPGVQIHACGCGTKPCPRAPERHTRLHRTPA